MDGIFFSREARSRILDGIQITKEKENLFFEGKKKKESSHFSFSRKQYTAARTSGKAGAKIGFLS